jgi:ribosome maturation factor RimP
MPATQGIRERVLQLIEPLVTRLGYELVDVEWAAGAREGVLRLYIDMLPGDGSVAHVRVEDCERVSREVSALLDVEDPVPVGYALEVSSPGFDRVLRKPEHFSRFVGSRVKVELATARDGRRRYTGVLREAAETGIEVEVDGEPVRIGYGEIGKARLAA